MRFTGTDCTALVIAAAARQDVRDLLVLQVLKPAEHQHLALLHRQRRQRAAQEAQVLPAAKDLAGIRFRADRLWHTLLKKGRFSFALLHAVEVRIARHLVHPGREWVAIPISVPVFQHAKVHVLHQDLH
jgi:hypothetical protein